MMHLDTSTGTSIYIRQCALHQAAAELLKALENIIEHEHQSARELAEMEYIPPKLPWMAQAEAAILKARPKSSGESESGGGK